MAAKRVQPIASDAGAAGRRRSKRDERKPGRSKYDWVRGRELYEQGMNDHEIAAALGCDSRAVWHWRSREGLSANVRLGRPRA